MKRTFLIVFTVLLLSCKANGQNTFPNTLFLDDATESPEADLSSVAWIQGHWRGDAFGGVAEEIWSPPLGDSMMCVFKLVVDGHVTFYEIVTISEEEGSLILRLKHFDPRLIGWEEKEETVDFKLVKATENKVYFDGFTFEKVSSDEINIYVVIEEGDRKTEMKFNYHKVQ